MRKVFLTSSLTLIALVLLLIACERKEAAPKTENKPIALVDGTLRFASEKVLEETKESLKHKDQSELTKWENQFSGFISMRTAFNQIGEADVVKIATKKSMDGYEGIATLVEDGEDQELVRNIGELADATLADKDGWLYVGNDGYRYAYDRVIKVENVNAARRSQYGAVLTSNKADGVTVSFITRVTRKSNGTTRTLKNGRMSIAYNNEDVCIVDYWHGGALCCKKRFVGEIEGVGIDNLPTNQDSKFRNIRALSKHQKRTSGIWYGDATNELTLISNAQIREGGQVTITLPAVNQTEYGVSETEWRYYSFCGPLVCTDWFNINSFTGEHSGICDDGRARACNTSWY